MPIDPKDLYMPGFKAFDKNKNDLLKLTKPKWPPKPRVRFHIKTDNANRLPDFENLSIPGFKKIFKKKLS